MYRKSMLFGDGETGDKILRSKDPKGHRYLGRHVKGFEKKRWYNQALSFATEADIAKFEQHSDLRKILAATGDSHFAEASPYDRNWGIGLSLINPEIHDRNSWRGKNWSGIALEEARKKIFSDSCPNLSQTNDFIESTSSFTIK